VTENRQILLEMAQFRSNAQEAHTIHGPLTSQSNKTGATFQH